MAVAPATAMGVAVALAARMARTVVASFLLHTRNGRRQFLQVVPWLAGASGLAAARGSVSSF